MLARDTLDHRHVDLLAACLKLLDALDVDVAILGVVCQITR